MEKKFDGVKAIKIVANYEGSGCVNFDGKEQSYFLSKHKLFNSRFDNNLFAKKIFKFNKEDVQFKYKVSSECLRHEIFKESIPFQNPNIVAVPHILYNTISTPSFIMRGYMFTQTNNKPTIKRKSPFTLSDAIEVGEWRNSLQMEMHTRSGEKNNTMDLDVENKSNDSDTTLYNIENVGISKYEAIGFIDLTEAQFISDDVTYDRVCVGVEDKSVEEHIYLNSLKNNMVNFEPKFGYYYTQGSYTKDEWAERGVLLNKESVDMLVKEVLMGILNTQILRRNAYLKTNSLEITIVTNQGNYTEVINIDNLNEYTFNYAETYIESDDEKILKNKALVTEYLNNRNEVKNNKKKAILDKKNKKDEKSDIDIEVIIDKTI
jgi:hypothetical protein